MHAMLHNGKYSDLSYTGKRLYDLLQLSETFIQLSEFNLVYSVTEINSDVWYLGRNENWQVLKKRETFSFLIFFSAHIKPHMDSVIWREWLV